LVAEPSRPHRTALVGSSRVVLALTQGLELLALFVVLPFVVAVGVIWFVSWRADGQTPPVRTSEVLATGDEASGEIVNIKTFGGFLDTRPMVRFALRVTADGEPFDLDVTQSIPRSTLRDLSRGDVVKLRVTRDRRAGAIVL
jgi:hypothetical protein